jgi:hypothetical protein
MSQLIFKPKSPILSSQAGFCGRTKTLLAPHSRTFNGGEGVKMICQLSYLPDMVQRAFFLIQIDEVEAGRPLAVPGQHHDELGGGCPNQQQKRVCCRPLALDKPLQTVCPNF